MHNPEPDFGVGRTVHLADDLFGGEARNRNIVNMGDTIADRHAGLRSWAITVYLPHFDEIVLRADIHTESTVGERG